MNYRVNAFEAGDECCGGCDHPAHRPGYCAKCYLESGCNATRRRLAQLHAVLAGIGLYAVLLVVSGAAMMPWRDLLAICAWVLLAIAALCALVFAGVVLLRTMSSVWVGGGPVARAMRDCEMEVRDTARVRVETAAVTSRASESEVVVGGAERAGQRSK